MAVNQKQVAERVGVSISLVSRVLSGTARDIGISDQTIRRVMEAANEMGYVPNVAAQTLKGKPSNTIGVVVYDFQDPFFGSTLEQLQSIAHEQGYSLVLTGFQGRHPNSSDLTPLHKHAIDGLIVLGSADHSAWLEGFGALPIVRVGHCGAAEKNARVSIDELDATRQLLVHLASRGISRCTYIGSSLHAHKVRYAALEKNARTMGIGLEKVLAPTYGFSAGFEVTDRLLKQGAPPTALVCATDMIAMGALRALHDAGVQRKVTGFDDIPGAAQFIPSITTVRQPIDEIIMRAFNAVIESSDTSEILLKGRLIARSSS